MHGRKAAELGQYVGRLAPTDATAGVPYTFTKDASPISVKVQKERFKLEKPACYNRFLESIQAC